MSGSAERGRREELPLACTLGPEDGQTRLRRWQRLHETAAPTVRVIEGELQIQYRSAPGVREELMELVAAERSCCSFVAWSVIDEGAELVLQVTAPPDAPEAIEPVADILGAISSPT